MCEGRHTVSSGKNQVFTIKDRKSNAYQMQRTETIEEYMHINMIITHPLNGNNKNMSMIML